VALMLQLHQGCNKKSVSSYQALKDRTNGPGGLQTTTIKMLKAKADLSLFLHIEPAKNSSNRLEKRNWLERLHDTRILTPWVQENRSSSPRVGWLNQEAALLGLI